MARTWKGQTPVEHRVTDTGDTRQPWTLALLFLVLSLALWAAPSTAELGYLAAILRYAAAFAILWILPGLAWAALIPWNAAGRMERTAVGLGLSFVVTPIVILLMAFLPGPLSEQALLLALGVATLLPVGLAEFWPRALRRSRDKSMPKTKEVASESSAGKPVGRSKLPGANRLLKHRAWAWLLIPLFIAGCLRAVHLHYSQFQGDEAIVAISAARTLEGDDLAVFRLKKGPGEMTIVAAGWRLTGILNEWMARLPFAWASLLGLVAVYLLCRRLDSPALGAVAVALLAIEGYLLAFGRLVQYQSIVFALTGLGLFCLALYYRSGSAALLLSGAALFAGGLLAHYDALLALPAGLLLVAGRLYSSWPKRRRWNRRDVVSAALPPVLAALLGLALVSLFYVPFLQSPYVERTSSYVARRVGSSFFNNLPSTFVLSAVYDSVYYLGLLLVGLILALVTDWSRWPTLGRWIGALLLVAVTTAVLWPGMWSVAGTPVVWVPVALLLAGALLAPEHVLERRALWMWLAVPSLVYLFFVADPLTHVHTFFVPWAILASTGLTQLARWASRLHKGVRWPLLAAAAAVYLLSANYAVMVFVDHTPEYKRTFPAYKSPWYWTPYAQMPSRGLFGFPYQAGWKVAGVQMQQGLLGTNYASNEEAEITRYYMHQALRWECPTPDVYITANQVQDEARLRWDQIDSDYQASAIVMVNDQPKLAVHQRRATGAPATLYAPDYARLFDLTMTPDRVASPAPKPRAEMPVDFSRLRAELGGEIRLEGFQVDTAEAYPGGYIDLILFWEPLGAAPTTTEYTVFTHLSDGQNLIGQLDGPPVCGRHPTTRWRPGEVVIDPIRIPIRNDANPGAAYLSIGMYDSSTYSRLPIVLDGSQAAGDSIQLTEVTIQPARLP